MRRKEIIILILCLLVGFVLRFSTFDQKSLWMDEIHTFNDSKDGLKAQLGFYKEKPTYLHPPLFFVLTHLFYPFTKPERDLRILPVIFGTLSIPMIYFLARLFSPAIALPCSISLAFMAYHISISQDGRAYALLMFFSMTGLYFFMKHLQTSKRWYLLPAAFFFALLFHTSYSSIPFIALSQILWFYRLNEDAEKPHFSSFLIFNGLLLLFCLPWIIFVAVNYKGRAFMDLFHREDPGSFRSILYGIFHDWVPRAPLMIISVILLILYPIFSKFRKNAFVFLAIFILPIGGLYLYCKLFKITHFITSRYFILFLPLFFITLYLALNTIEEKFKNLRKILRLRFLFVILLILSNLVILPLYYRSEKQNFKGLVGYLKGQLRVGDKILDLETMSTLGILHYFGANPEKRHFILDSLKLTEKGFEYTKAFIYQNRKFTIYHSKDCCSQYMEKGSRLWIITGNSIAKTLRENTSIVFKAYFDGSFSSFGRFPTDASMYLFLWDPESRDEKGMDMPIE